jgi:3-deoxy-D-arabino-heptulosonate 7-phosphate (DAHP) synthase
MDVRELEWVIAAADVIQVGSRNMQNYSLLYGLARWTSRCF